MFKIENAQLGPNLLTKMLEEQPQPSTTRRPLLKDATNLKSRECRFAKPGQCRGDEPSLLPSQLKDQSIGMKSQKCSQKQNQSHLVSKLSNLLIELDSSDCIEEEVKQQPSTRTNANEESTRLDLSRKTIEKKTMSENGRKIPDKNMFLLDLQSEQQELPSSRQQVPPPLQVQVQVTHPFQHVEKQMPEAVQLSQQKITQHLLKVPSKPQFLLNFQSEEDEDYESQKIDQVSSVLSRQPASNKKMVIRLGGLISRFRSKYYLQPIPYGAVFECVIKRDRSESDIKYHLFDCVTMKNFMTIIKDSKGYLIISKFDDKHSYDGAKIRETVVGRIFSNFFGTDFNCSLQNIAYVKNQNYPIKDNCQKVITIQYQTNILGLNGPRKISAYIAKEQQPQTSNLNEIYQQEKKRNANLSILKFNNKSPKWDKDSKAYVLNFHGRATISSIKNFIIVDQNEDSITSEKVLFGKFGRELFNLDIRYPFSLMQGVALAVSAFDRKLACQ